MYCTFSTDVVDVEVWPSRRTSIAVWKRCHLFLYFLNAVPNSADSLLKNLHKIRSVCLQYNKPILAYFYLSQHLLLIIVNFFKKKLDKSNEIFKK